MDTNCTPLLADIFLYSYEAEFIQSLLPALHYYARRKAEMHENRRFFSTRVDFAMNAYAYVFKAPSRS